MLFKKNLYEMIKISWKLVKFLFTFFLSVGWVLPFFMSNYFLYKWFNLDVDPVVYDRVRIGNSFPFKKYAWDLFIISFIWVCFSVVFWFIRFQLINKKLNDMAKVMNCKSIKSE